VPHRGQLCGAIKGRRVDSPALGSKAFRSRLNVVKGKVKGSSMVQMPVGVRVCQALGQKRLQADQCKINRTAVRVWSGGHS
jgi:hypothetical protein